MKRIGMVSLFVFAAIVANNVNAQIAFDDPSQKQMVMTNLSSMPLAFTENRGQWGEKTLFKAEVGGATFYFCGDEVAYLFTRNTDELEELPYDAVGARHAVPEGMPNKLDRPRYKKEALLIKAQFVDANPNPNVIGENRLSHNCNYFYGNDAAKWRADVPNYSAITYKDIWPGIDLKYHGNTKGMKYDFIVNPGADISQIRIRYEGVDNLSLSNAGDLEVQTRFGLVYENIPEIYQEKNGAKVSVSGSYRLIEPGPYGQAVFGFAAEDYNPSFALVIDPELLYSTYLGGSGDDAVWGSISSGPGIAVDGSSNVYATGRTVSSNFPTVNPYDGDLSGPYDVFVTKLSATGDALFYSTYLGGSNSDFGNDIAVDGAGSAYLTGSTSSTDFPTANPYDESYSGNGDVFITKLSPSGNSLIYSTYLGGSSGDGGECIAVDGSGNAYLTGRTSSSDFPTLNPYDANYNGSYDVFVTKLSVTGDALLYSTYLGGSDDDLGFNIATDASGNAYLTGYTYSSNFPTANAFDYSFNGGTSDVFVTKLSSSGNFLVYSTYLGGSGRDLGVGIAVDTSRNAYVTGNTCSTNFPTVNPYDGSFNSMLLDEPDVFVTKLSTTGNSLVYSTYLGGGIEDWGSDIAVNSSGNAYVVGSTASSTSYPPVFPTVDPYDGSYNGNFDVFVAKFSTGGSTLVFSTFLGGGNWDYGLAIALSGSGNNVYLSGSTYSSNFPRVHPYDGSYNGNADVFLAKFRMGGYDYLPGDVNMSEGNWPPGPFSNDVTYLVNAFRGLPSSTACNFDGFWASADPNGDCAMLSNDVTFLVNFFRGLNALDFCDDYPPAWPTPADLPPFAPPGWPNCE